MNKIHHIFIAAAAVCAALAGCQSLDEPAPVSGTVTTPDMVEVGAFYAVFPSVTLSGTAHSCYFYMSESSSMTSTTQVSENATVEGLTANTTYYYRACATDDLVEVYGDVKSFTTDNAFYVASVDSIGADGSSSKFSAYNSYASTIGALVEVDTTEFITSIGNGGGISITRSGAGSGETWSLSDEIPLTDGSSYLFYAYYPYSEDITADNTLLPISVKECSSVAWGQSQTLSWEDSAVNIEMQEMLVTVSLSIVCEGREVSSVSVNNKGRKLSAYGYLDVTSGEITFDEQGYYYNNAYCILSGSTSFSDSEELTLRFLPGEFGDEDLQLEIWYGDTGETELSVSTYFPSSTWEAGGTYSYDVTYVTEKLVITTSSDSAIDEWKDGGSTDDSFNL